jgi:hypothetical protein
VLPIGGVKQKLLAARLLDPATIVGIPAPRKPTV